MEDNQQLITEDSTITSFSSLTTWKIAVLQILLLISYFIVILTLSVDGLSLVGHCDLIFSTYYCQSGIWLISLIVDHYYKWQHHLLYLKGYFEFHKDISKWTGLMFIGLSLINVGFLIYSGSLYFKYKNIEEICNSSSLTVPLIALNIMILIEVVLLVSFLVIYCVKVLKFNEEQPVADVRRVRFWAPEDSSSVLEVGYRDKGQDMVDLLQKQADLIQYYKGKIMFLNEKIMVLSQNAVEC